MRYIPKATLFSFILMLPYALKAASVCPQWVAKVMSVQGKVQIQAPQGQTWQPVITGDQVCPGDKLRVLKLSRATLRLRNDSLLNLDQNTTLSLSAPAETDVAWLLKLFEGATFFRSRQPQHLNIQTPFINAVHEGTEFSVLVDKQRTQISVFDGEVQAVNKAGRIQIKKGFTGIADANTAPRMQPLTVNPQDAVQWSLYYPPILDYQDIDIAAINPTIKNTLSIYDQGDSQQAIAVLDNAGQNSHSLMLKAALLLNVGRVEEAQTVIQQILHSDLNKSGAYALQAIIAVTKNQRQAALDFAKQAVKQDSESASAEIALSYAQQSLFNIEAALLATEKATQISPENALAWARLSELQLALGEQGEALASAEKAQKFNPKLARTQIVLGFANLAQTEIAAGQQAFERAIKLDSSDPLARLGLGLAKIRTGELEEGRQELETAVNLDPNNAVIRSYLGKAFYELRNKDYAGKEFEIAKEMDAKDPTPWFYDAILKQTTNRPIEALQDMQRAVELNDNRAVYRSKLLLDSDSAARNASLGRIYNDLGFQQRGLLEGWSSVNSDPSNYSAHRFLADNYVALPRHEVARLSELLKAQLLQPINITPVQPQAAESNILILDGLGSSITSFNEYNPLFARNRFALQGSGFYGSNDTVSDEVVHSGVWDRFSYSLGQFHYQTDGFRENNQQNKDAYNVFAQAKITDNTSAQVEYRRSEQEFGDINQGFFTQTFSPIKHKQSENNTVRGGLHHKFTENSDLLMSVVHSEEKSNGIGVSQGVTATLAPKIKGTQYELQHIYRHNDFDLTLGMNYLINQTGGLSAAIDLNTPLEFKQNEESEHAAFYLYSNIKTLPTLLMTVGFSQDFYKQTQGLLSSYAGVPLPDASAEVSRNPLNPKFGLTWTPTKDTTFRFAAFRSLKRGIIQKQTLEPTQVAGFNQFYDDVDGTVARRIGFGLDHKFNSKIFAGAEISRRYLDVPYNQFASSGTYSNTNWNEKNARAYVNWTPTELFSAGVDYSYEKLNRNNDFFDTLNNNSSFFTQLETHRAQLFGNFYHPSGFISKLKLSYVDQTGNFKDTDTASGEVIPDSSAFFLLDTELGFRFQKRHGLVSLGIKNLLDERFNFQGTDANQPELPQGRFLYSRLTLSF
ncbi:MAG: tetratricopeptide repeat protein [Methylococcales bacterium]